MENIKIYDSNYELKEILIPNINHIIAISIEVIDGGENGIIYLTNGNIIPFRADDEIDLYEEDSGCRYNNAGLYVIHGEDIQKWISFKPSDDYNAAYERKEEFSNEFNSFGPSDYQWTEEYNYIHSLFPKIYIKNNNCEKRTNIVIPNGTINIDAYSFFGRHDICDVIIPEGVISIGDYAFYGCDNMQNVTLPKSLKKIGNYAFNYGGDLKIHHNGSQYEFIQSIPYRDYEEARMYCEIYHAEN